MFIVALFLRRIPIADLFPLVHPHLQCVQKILFDPFICIVFSVVSNRLY